MSEGDKPKDSIIQKPNQSQILSGQSAKFSLHSSELCEELNRLKSNDHLCLIYELAVEWRTTIIPFLAMGLKQGEKCIYILGTHSKDRILGYLREEGVDVVDAEKSGRLLFLHHTDAYTEKGHFDTDEMISLLVKEVEKGIAEGYHVIRMMQEIGPIFKDQPNTEHLLEYEAKLNRDFFSKYPCTCICLYDRWRSDPGVIKNAIMTHPLLMRSYQIYQNFYYVVPEEFLVQKRDEREVQDMLSSIEQEGENQKRLRFFSGALEHSSQPFIASYPDGRVMYCNSAFYRLTHYTEEELRRMRWHKDLTPSEWHEVEAKAIEKLDRTGQPQRYETECIRKDGSRVPVEVFVHHVRNSEGHIQYYYTFVTDITERKCMEERLRESEEKYRHLVENIDEVIYTVNHEGVITYISPAVGKFSKYSSSEVIGRSLFEFIHPEDLPRIKENFQKLFSGIAEPHEYRYVTKSGEIRWFRVSSKPIFEQNRLVSIQGVATDITDRKKIEEALRESEEKYRMLVDNSIDGIAIVQGLEIKFVNRALVEMFGCNSEDEMVGHPFTEFVSSEYRNLMVERGFAREEGKDVSGFYEFKAQRKDGTEFSAEISVSAITYEGNVARHGIIRDITRRKRAEAMLLESTEMYCQTVKAVPDAMVIVDLDGKIIEVSDRAVELYGSKRAEELLGRSIFEYIAPKDKKEMRVNFEKLLKEGAIRKVECALLKKDGTCFTGEINASVIKGANGKPKAIIATTRELSAIAQCKMQNAN